jgi:splicing factor U2AF 65 kDa subunit
VRDECKQYGVLRDVVIPRPGAIGVGKVFLEYAEVTHAQAAALALAGRQFASRIVKAEYHDEGRFAARDLA